MRYFSEKCCKNSRSVEYFIQITISLEWMRLCPKLPVFNSHHVAMFCKCTILTLNLSLLSKKNEMCLFFRFKFCSFYDMVNTSFCERKLHLGSKHVARKNILEKRTTFQFWEASVIDRGEKGKIRAKMAEANTLLLLLLMG